MKKTIITLLVIASVSSAFAVSYARGSVSSSFRSSPSRSYSSPTRSYTAPTRSYTPTKTYSAPKTATVVKERVVQTVQQSPSFFSLNNIMLGWLIWGNHNTQNKLNNLENRIATSTATSTK